MHEWLEWEHSILRPAVYSQDATQLSLVLKTLENALKSSDEFLVGMQHSLADIIIFSAMFHLRHDDALPETITGYLTKLSQLPLYEQGVQKVVVTDGIRLIAEKLLV